MWQRTAALPWRFACAMALSAGGAGAFGGIDRGDRGWWATSTTTTGTPTTTLCASGGPMIPEGYSRMPLPARGAETHAIFGSLAGRGKIEAYEVYRRPSFSSQEVVVARVVFGDAVDGHPGVVHGGILSLVFDDLLGFGYEALGDVAMAVTANLTVDYRAPVPAGTTVRVAATLERREGRKLYWKASMTSTDGEILYAEASSLYIIPRSSA